jgi:phage terminase large subunit
MGYLHVKLENEFYFGKSPLIIRHKRTNTAFYFCGVDAPMKIKSAKIAKGYVMALWFEELAEFSGVEDIDIVSDTFIRQDLGDKEVKIYYSYNPPRNPYE